MIKRILLALAATYMATVDAERHYASPTKTPTRKPTYGPTKAYYKLEDPQIGAIISKTNYARSHVTPAAARMNKVSWNYTFQHDLESFVQNTPKEWWFSNSEDPTVKFNGFTLAERHPFFKAKYPGWGYLIHDGCQSDNKAVQRIFDMRAIKQKPYFKLSNCRTDGFNSDRGHINNYVSCAKDPNYPKVSNKPWSWVWQYYPPLVLENTTEIACALLSQSGPNAAGGFRPNHFFCYRNNMTPQINEVPYKAGKAGSECKGKVKNKLCV